MSNSHLVAPEHTAVRVSLWRALHAELDAKPLVLEDTFGPVFADEPNWRNRPEMHPQGSRRVRASIVARARFLEELIEAEIARGITQYVILGAGLDSLAFRRPEWAEKIRIFEVDQPGPQAWKKKRLEELGLAIPAHLTFVPVDFEAGMTWQEGLSHHGFSANLPALVSSTGVSMYLTRESNLATLRHAAALAPGSTFAETIMLPMDLLEPEDQPMQKMVIERTREAGTPFLSFFRPAEILQLAKEAGFAAPVYVSPKEIRDRYFTGRSDALAPASGEGFLIARS